MDSTPKLLIIEDEPDLVLGLRDNFEFEGFRVLDAGDGENGLALAVSEEPDLILLDLMLPKMSGYDVCRELRRRGFKMPVIMLTAKSQEADIIAGLELGADDYVTKPFSVRQLVARVKAHLRRSSGKGEQNEYSFGDIWLDFRNYQAKRAGEPLTLSPKEFDLLRYFVRRRGETVSREDLLNDVWDIHDYPMSRTVDNHIAKLRQKIEAEPANPRWIITVHRTGYKFLG